LNIYEYLFAAVIIVIILLGSSVMIGTLSDPHRDVSEKEQLKDAAQKILTQILLDPGDPPDWGNNITIGETDLSRFGLARYGESTREAYVLDLDKVLRLNRTEQPYLISPTCVLNLLNLGQDYGFALEISSPLIVNISETPNTDRYEISVSSEYGEIPMASADVAAKIYYFNSTENEITSTAALYNYTSYNGKCTVDFGNIPTEMKTLIVAVNYYGVRLVKTYTPILQTPTVVPANMLGNYIFSSDLSITSEKEAYEIIVAKNVTSGKYMIEDVTFNLSKVAPTQYELSYLDPYTVTTLALSEDNSKLVVASRDATSTYSSISGSWSFPFAYSLERTVTVGFSTYVVRLYIWRMSW
jgi:hypothetical protein